METKWLTDHWRKYQCPECRNGDRSGCTANKENAKASREADGKTYYYCFVGCLMLQLDEDSRIKFIESQFNTKGHYEKLALDCEKEEVEK